MVTYCFGWADFFLMIESPNHPDSPLRDVVEASGAYRDKAIIDGVKNVWNDHDIFMVYGNYHKRAHENELRKFSESKEQ
jgi:gentisate 1,2-dioxygenase